MRFAGIVWCLLGWCLPAMGTTWYVGGAGREDASGMTPEQAFRTLQHAADQTRPGDMVFGVERDLSRGWAGVGRRCFVDHAGGGAW